MRYLIASSIYTSVLGVLFAVSSFQVNAHGYVRVPQSRSYQCSYNDDFNKGQKTPTNFNCGLGAEYEPQSIEVHNGFPEFGPPDGKIASGGIERFLPLDEQSPTRWNKIDMKTGNNTFTWFLTMQHSTTNWRFFITKNGWDQSAPLTRATFDLTPFCQRNDYGAIPPLKTDIPFSCKIPEDHEGYHVILATWDIADTQNAFYQVIDVNLSK
ncbi:lytic polysaccharide monooxygenase [Providencia manganoxydans]|uniref:lytic polysaccharide monooxygenase n=1 Tax=Providencia manganoxydans TaxID=2923283 RepID=UPI0034E61734